MSKIPLILRRLDILVNGDGLIFYTKKHRCTSEFFVHFVDVKKKFTDFLSELSNKKVAFYEPIIDQHAVLLIEYGVLRASLAADLIAYSTKRKTKTETDAIIHKIQATWALAAVLDQVYRNYLIVPREVNRLQRQQEEYRQWLDHYNISIPFTQNPIKVDPYAYVSFLPDFIKNNPYMPVSAQNIKKIHGDGNFPRLLLLRFLRWCRFMEPIINDYKHYRQWLQYADTWFIPFFTYFGWIFFLPRLLINLLVLARHVFFPRTAEEKSLGWKKRLEIHWNRRWYQLSNDIGWFSNGLALCFLLTGPLLPFGIGLSVFMQLFDLVNASVCADVEITRLCTLRDNYLLLAEDKDDVNEVVAALERRIDLERKILYFRVFNFLVLFVCVCLTIPNVVLNFYVPGLVLHPLTPLISASVAILITLMNYQRGQAYEKEKTEKYDAPFPSIPGSAAILIDKLPADLKDLRKNLGIYITGYIRINNDKHNMLIYVNKHKDSKLIQEIKLDDDELEYIDSQITFLKTLHAISNVQLQRISPLTGHGIIENDQLLLSSTNLKELYGEREYVSFKSKSFSTMAYDVNPNFG